MRRPINNVAPRVVRRFGRPAEVENATVDRTVSDSPESGFDDPTTTSSSTTSVTVRIEQGVQPDEFADQRGEVSEATVTIWIASADATLYEGGESDGRRESRVRDVEADEWYRVFHTFDENNGVQRALANEEGDL